jgi:hypothetical protein
MRRLIGLLFEVQISVGHVARMGESRGAYKVSVEEREERRPLGR